MVIDSTRIFPLLTFQFFFNYKLAIIADIIPYRTEKSSFTSSTAGSVSASEMSQSTGNIYDGTHIFPCVSGASV